MCALLLAGATSQPAAARVRPEVTTVRTTTPPARPSDAQIRPVTQPERAAAPGLQPGTERPRAATPRRRPSAARTVRAAPTLAVVLLALRGGDLGTGGMARIIRDRLQGIRASFSIARIARPGASLTHQLAVARRVGTERGAAIVVWRDFTQPDNVHLYYPPTGSGKGQVRTVQQPKDTPEGRNETVGIIVSSSVEALVYEREADRLAQARAKAVALTIKKRPPERRFSGTVRLHYEFNSPSADVELGQHGGELELHLGFLRRWSVLVGFGASRPLLGRQEPEVSLDLTRYVLRAGASFQLRYHKLSVHFLASILLDIISWDSSTNQGWNSLGPGRIVAFAIEPSARLQYQMTASIGLYLGVGLRLLPKPPEFDARDIRGDLTPLLKMEPVQPTAVAGVSLQFY